MEKQLHKWYKHVNICNISGQLFLHPGHPLAYQADENIEKFDKLGGLHKQFVYHGQTVIHQYYTTLLRHVWESTRHKDPEKWHTQKLYLNHTEQHHHLLYQYFWCDLSKFLSTFSFSLIYQNSSMTSNGKRVLQRDVQHHTRRQWSDDMLWPAILYKTPINFA